LNASLSNLKSVTGNLRDNNAAISSTLNNLSSITASLDSADLEGTLHELDSTLIALKNTMAKIDTGAGTMGKLVNDSSLYINLDSTTYHLNLLMKDLKEHPKRYVHFSVFGKK
jgi:phospholipid/cholesterol/gamma-HCH transport system substrate-binding protein